MTKQCYSSPYLSVSLAPVTKQTQNTSQTRRSIFGFFVRRCYVSFGKLSYTGVIKLQEDFQAWVAGDYSAGYERVRKDRIRNGVVLCYTYYMIWQVWPNTNRQLRYEIRRRQGGTSRCRGVRCVRCCSSVHTVSNTTRRFEKAQDTGDHHLAVENLRRFFEQRFHEQPDSYAHLSSHRIYTGLFHSSEVRQHALLNSARLEFNLGHLDAAKRVFIFFTLNKASD